MIDSGATGNFMTQKIAEQQGYQIQQKERPYELRLVDGQPISSNGGGVTHETVPLTMITADGHKERIQFDIVHMDNHACILGVPWLRQHNPQIDWRKRRVLLSQCQCERISTGKKREKPSQGREELCATLHEPGDQARAPSLRIYQWSIRNMKSYSGKAPRTRR